MPTIDPAQLESGVVSTNGAIVTRRPLSRPGLIVGVPYVYTIPNCEADTPIDFDGSLWDLEVPAGVSTPAGESGVVTVMSHDTGQFRAGATAYGLRRHEGTKDYQSCHS
jgi:hypothetical protein